MTPFKFRTLESAPAESRPLLQSKQKECGFVPHLEGQLAASPLVLRAYSTLFEQFESSSLSPAERLIVLLASSVENRDAFGVAAWTHRARESRYLPPTVIEALRMGDAIGNPRQDVLANLARQIARRGGRASGVPVAAFLAAGYQEHQVMEVLLGVSVAAMGAYASNLLQTPLNWELQLDWWTAPLRDPARDPLSSDQAAAKRTHAA